MGNNEISGTFDNSFKGKTVLVTGHTGFKGSWLSIWLIELGAKVIGYSLEPPTKENNFDLTNLKEKLIDIRADVRDLKKLEETIEKYKPEIVFHLAAQPIVLTAYQQPKETFETNVLGTVNVLEACRKTACVKVIVSITSDKCYQNQELIWGYRENDRIGGDDPYSASKGMSELAIHSYRFSFLKKQGVSVASVRAGNVIGGGDFAEFRLVVDCAKALLNNKQIEVRNPDSVRPWQHVLAPLSGYLWLAAKMLKEKKYDEAFNFGPLENKAISSKEIVEKMIEFWGSGSWKYTGDGEKKHETGLLKLNWEKAANFINWYPAYTWEEAIKETVEWFKAYEKKQDMHDVCVNQIKKYTEKAKELEIEWAN